MTQEQILLKRKSNPRGRQEFSLFNFTIHLQNVFNKKLKEAGSTGHKHAARGQLLKSAIITAKTNYL